MNIASLPLARILKNRLSFDSTKADYLKEEITNLKYPLGAFPINIVKSNKIYRNISMTDNIEYFNQFINYLYSDIYSQSEINIINIYLSLLVEFKEILKKEEISYLVPLINIDSNKKEIQYCLDEIRYRYLTHLIHTDSDDENTIQKLFNKLLPIEQEFNSFQMWEHRE